MEKIKSFLLSQKTYAFLIVGLFITIPLNHAYGSIGMIIVLCITAFSACFHPVRFNKHFLPPILLFALVLLSLSWTIDLKESYRGVVKNLPLLTIPLTFFLMPKIDKFWGDRILIGFARALACFAVFCIAWAGFRFVSGETKIVFFYHSLVKILEMNAIYMSCLVSVTFLYMVAKSKRTTINIVTLLLLALFLILLSSKMLLFISLVITSIIGFRKLKTTRSKTIFAAALSVFIASLLLIAPIGNRFANEFDADIKEVFTSEKFSKIYPWTGTTIRLFQARIFFEMLEEDNLFFTGYGINASQQKIIEKQKHYNLYHGYFKYNFHNQYLQTFAELGFMGLLLLFACLGSLLFGYLKYKDPTFMILFIVFAALFVTETLLGRQRGIVFFLLSYCLLFKIHQDQEPKKIARPTEQKKF